MEIDQECVCNGLKRKKPLPTASGDDNRPPELVVTSMNNKGGCGADEQENQKEDLVLQAKSDREIEDTIPRIINKVEKFKEHLRRYEIELERRKILQSEKNHPTILSSGGLAGTNRLRSEYILASNALTNGTLTDQKMQIIVNELVNVGISESSDVGKAAEVFYDHPIKAKVLFALPTHMRKSYVQGLLYPQN